MNPNTLHIFFLPLLTPGHMLPMVDMAKLFAERGVKATIITTPVNASHIRHSIDRTSDAGHQIQVLQINFPSSVAGLPDGYDNLTACRTPYVTADFMKALDMLRRPFEQLLGEHRPDCVISDSFYPWTAHVASEFGIPRLIFHGTGSFALHVTASLLRNKAHEGVSSNAETFAVPELPHRIELTRSQLPDFVLSPPEYMSEFGISHLMSHGVVLNSFYELEPDYVRNAAAGLKTWHIGPISLCNKDAADKAARGDKASAEHTNCLSNWLDSKKPGSVLYVCFGSLCRFTRAQLNEIELALEASDRPFLWVVRDAIGNADASERSLPEGFEERSKGKGLIVRGWVPQILILDHEAIGGFVTHCGWNSCLEAISTGVPMIAWPMFAEQFFNEKLIVDVLKSGVGVGIERWSVDEEERVLVKRERIEEAVARLMGGGEEAEAMRRRAKELGVMAKRAVEEGGSSYNSMSHLIEHLIDLKTKKVDACMILEN